MLTWALAYMNSTDEISEDLIEAAILGDVMIVLVVSACVSFIILSRQ